MRVARVVIASMALALQVARGAGFEIRVVTDPTLRSGEPEVAVNPKNVDNIVFFAMTATQPFAPPGKERLTQKGFFDCQISVSFDRGHTWTLRPNPFMTGRQTLCADPMVAFGPDGTVYAAADGMSIDPTNPKHWLMGEVEVARSLDGGRTWTSPIITGTPFDRPYLVVDDSDGTVYLSSSCADPIASYCEAHRRFVLASRDRGLTWSRPVRMDTPRYGSPGEEGSISAANGWLAVAYVSPAGHDCPCLVFGRTRDAGASWVHLRVPTSRALGSLAQVGADPMRRDTYAIVAQSRDRLTYLVYVTHDGGRSWHGPAEVDNQPRKVGYMSWVAFSPGGVLGLVWRADEARPDEVPIQKGEAQPSRTFPYALWGAISRDGGATFSRPLQLSGAPSPAPTIGEMGPPDDESFVTLGRDSMYYAWGDWREGNLCAWYGRMPLAEFGP